MNTVLVVCIGNICRSPMAEVLLAKTLPQITVSSAGTGALIGHPADPIAQALMAERGLDLGYHRARQVTQAMCVEADLILTMDEGQRRHIENNYPLTRGRVFRLAETAKLNIPDPYRMGQEAFEHALQLIDAGVKTWAERIRKFK
ncbi:low molecular weight protein-tyrosine-phosphatase [Variovorax sp. OV700]|uniref:low molecular weight protein-tyrosine-phosphatase n=1 Tax=Variovorax sp. OV700 TaxID=1882826 RepID=UPI00088D8FE4|nr:low molecular weight protein-tyrosine-phosphatase [Variovorax sp. OV700]SDH43466.1 protein-tyrosine phosphatase [Variovorax sp. OV700]